MLLPVSSCYRIAANSFKMLFAWMDEPSADEEAVGGNGPDGGLRDFSYFVSTVDHDAAPPFASQSGRDIPQRTRIGAGQRFAGFDLHADNAVSGLENQVDFEAGSGPVKVELA